MSQRLVIRPRAVIDVAGIFGQIAENRPRSALRFYDAYAAALKLIAQLPEAGGQFLLPELEGFTWRYVRPRGFRKYLISIRSLQRQLKSFVCCIHRVT